MTTVVFLHAPGKSPFDWQDVAEHLPPMWAVAAPALNNCADEDAVFSAINRDALSVSDEPVVLVSAGRSAIAARAFQRHFPARVSSVIAIEPQWTCSVFHRVISRSIPYVNALSSMNVTGAEPAARKAPVVELSAEETQYPAQCAAAVYRVVVGE